MNIVYVIIRGFVSLITLFLITKLLGKKQVSQLSLFDYVIGISIGNFAAELTVNLDTPALYGLTAIVFFGLMAYLVSFLTMKSIILRRFFIGNPTVLIQNGKILISNLKKVNFDINDLLEECRESGYFDISNINTAVMEVNGKLSFIPVASNRPLTTKDINLLPEQDYILANVIIDGKIMRNNLNNIKKDEKWLMHELKDKGIKVKNILLCTVDNNYKVNVYIKNVNEESFNVLE